MTLIEHGTPSTEHSPGMDAIAAELDTIYQRLIGRMEALVTEADAVDKRLRELFQAEVGTSILDPDPLIDPLRPMTPNAAYRLIIGRLLEAVQGRVATFRTTCMDSFEDLLAWGSQETMGRSMVDIRHALAEGRRHSIARAWSDIRLRIAPKEDPTQAREHAIRALVEGCCVRVHGRILLPYMRVNGHAMRLQTELNTALRELPYVIAPTQLRMISTVCQSVATLDALSGEADRGGRVADVASKLAKHLRVTNGSYLDGDRFGNHRELEILLRLDHAVYEIAPDLFEAIVETLRARYDNDIVLIHSTSVRR